MSPQPIDELIGMLENRYGPSDRRSWERAVSDSELASLVRAAVWWTGNRDLAPTLAELRAHARQETQDTNVRQLIARAREHLRGDAA